MPSCAGPISPAAFQMKKSPPRTGCSADPWGLSQMARKARLSGESFGPIRDERTDDDCRHCDQARHCGRRLV